MRVPALEALDRLREGNRRFLSGSQNRDTSMSNIQRLQFLAGQQPF